MAGTFDVESRLAEGRPAVDRIERCVRACELTGYRDIDLTAHAGQIRDWFGAEDGLDLNVLDSDCAALRAALAATERALALQQGQLPVLADAWLGRGAAGFRTFLRHHDAASAQLVADLRQTGAALAALREDLWYLVDGKVAATQAIDDRRLAERGPWLAAAETVTTGAGDRAAASELIDQQVKPFVDNDIRLDWVAAMRTATEAVAAAFDRVIARLSELAVTPFEMPGEFGPSGVGSPAGDGATGFGGDGAAAAAPVAADTAPAGSIPVSAAAGGAPVSAGSPVASMPSNAPPMWSTAEPASTAPTAPTTPAASSTASPVSPMTAPYAEPAFTAPAMSSLGGLGSGMSSGLGSGMSAGGSGFTGLGQQLADVLGSLLGSVGDDGLEPPVTADPTVLDSVPDKDPETDDPDTDDPETGTDGEATEADNADPGKCAEDTGEPAEYADAEPEPAGSEHPDATPGTEPESAEPAPTPVPAAAPPAPLASPAPIEPGDTPCEIAMDELPQAGG